MIPTLRQAALNGNKYANKLLTAFDAEASAPLVSQMSDSQPLLEPLTPRELEVLHLICDGLSNQDIAGRLTVTLNTVKKHTSHIYGKLGARSRTQAIARAQELDIR